MTHDTDYTARNMVVEDRLAVMLDKQLELQRRYNNGIHPGQFGGQRKWQYIKDMILATEDELHEALRETPWKPWSSSKAFDREAFKDELVDGWHFYMNLLIAANISAEEFFTAYLRKNGVNHDRIDEGYSSPTG